MKIMLEVEFEYDENHMHSGDEDQDAKKWFYQDILTDKLDVISNEIGDPIGSIKIVRINNENTPKMELLIEALVAMYRQNRYNDCNCVKCRDALALTEEALIKWGGSTNE